MAFSAAPTARPLRFIPSVPPHDCAMVSTCVTRYPLEAEVPPHGEASPRTIERRRVPADRYHPASRRTRERQLPLRVHRAEGATQGGGQGVASGGRRSTYRVRGRA